MYGYIIPDKMNMYIKDFSLFKAYYCGLCKALGKTGAPHTRFCVSYDMTFLSALLHSLNGVEPEIKNAPCVLSPLRKKSFVVADEISRQVCDITVMLAYFKIIDDVIDGQKGRALFKPWLYFRMRKAKKRMPDVYGKIKESYKRLNELEKKNVSAVDMAAEPFADMLKCIVAMTVKDCNDDTKTFAYQLGKLVYLFDAVDDVEKDFKKKRYNPFNSAYGAEKTKAEFIEKHYKDIEFALKSSYNALMDAYDKMPVKISEGVISNVVYLGIDMQIKKLLKGERKCETTRL
ncbi:MAG: DUF5685 family protein [Christensenellales bacterium]